MDAKRKEALLKISAGLEPKPQAAATPAEPTLEVEAAEVKPHARKKNDKKALSITLNQKDFDKLKKLSDFLWKEDREMNANLSRIIRAALQTASSDAEFLEAYRKAK